MKAKLKEEIEDLLCRERVNMRKEIRDMIDSAGIKVIKQASAQGRVDYFSIRIRTEDAIKAIMTHLKVNFKRLPEEYTIVKLEDKK